MPLQILSAAQIASIPTRVRAYGDMTRLAREWGVSPDAIRYHVRGGKATRAARELRRADRRAKPLAA